MGGSGHVGNQTGRTGLVGRAMSKRATRIIATAALLVLGAAPMPATMARELGSFRSCGSDQVLYDPSTDDIAVYFSPINKYIVFPAAGQMRYLSRSHPYGANGAGATGNAFIQIPPQWQIETANKVRELRATGRCKTNAGG